MFAETWHFKILVDKLMLSVLGGISNDQLSPSNWYLYTSSVMVLILSCIEKYYGQTKEFLDQHLDWSASINVHCLTDTNIELIQTLSKRKRNCLFHLIIGWRHWYIMPLINVIVISKVQIPFQNRKFKASKVLTLAKYKTNRGQHQSPTITQYD